MFKIKSLSLYVNLVVTTKKKHTVNTQKRERNLNMTLVNIIKPQGKREREGKEQQKAVNTYLLIITLL